MIRHKKAGAVAAALASSLLLSLAQPASAAVRGWVVSPTYPYPGNWHCTENYFPPSSPKGAIDVCVINSHNGVEPVYKAVLVVWNLGNTGFQMSATKINLWAGPATSAQVADDGCTDSGLSANRYAACYGTAVTRSTVCNIKPNANSVTAAAAINIPALSSSRITRQSKTIPVSC
ncbi:hypothetical protein SK803_09430 [Lentzea sp. BCCO 10_0856]|uniref:Secreted protein n=1 Tax=Lentzea miocenica TaxID=3095431 RepID=A0ABU4SX03_9PSEU|nr:hypothetical protein [Lentzea sp. BCCO 10_0856]MDX8030431.1 hypothetical protein [Lentzea sp. BCCO 10_0856]